MSSLLKKMPTPKAKKALTLKIDLNAPKYTETGDLQNFSDEDPEDEEHFIGIFNAHLLEDDYLDKQSYKGSMTDDEES